MCASPNKLKVMFDTNAFDKAIENVSFIKKHLDRISIYITPIQVEELANIPDVKWDARKAAFLCLAELRPLIVPCIFTFDHVDFSHFSFQMEPSYWEILKDNKGNLNDALIAATSIHEKCVLITNDIELAKRVHSVSGGVKSFEDFMGLFEDDVI